MVLIDNIETHTLSLSFLIREIHAGSKVHQYEVFKKIDGLCH